MRAATIQLLIVAAIAFVIIAGALVSTVIPALVRRSSLWAPAGRHRSLLALGLAPAAITFAASIAIMLPSGLARFWPAYDHCLTHGGHAHLCWVHQADHAGSLIGWAAIGAAAIAFALISTSAIGSGLRARALIERLFGAARFESRRNIWVLPTSEPVCLSAGMLEPRVFVSEGLLVDASPGDLAIMLAHEAAHVRRRDMLTRCVLQWSTITLVPSARRQLLQAADLSAEQACDEEAAQRAGDRLAVAETLIAMERRMSRSAHTAASPLGLAFGVSSVPARVEAMLVPPRASGAGGLVIAGVAASLFAILMAFDAVHHATESALAFLLH